MLKRAARLVAATCVLCSVALSTTGCYDLIREEDVETTLDGDTIPVSIEVRSLTADLPYPISVYAFEDSGSGRCVSRQTLATSSDVLGVNLPAGRYRFVALAGADGYTLSAASPTLASTISINGDHYSDVPLMMGSADVTVTNVASSVNIMLTYAVASLRVQLLGVPESVTSAEVTVGQQAAAISMTGEATGAEKAVLPMRRVSGAATTWTSGLVYLLPGTQGNTVLTISLSDATSARNFGYTYSKPLAAATPYEMNGTFVEAEKTFAIGGNISVGDWKTPVVIDFEFGDGVEGGEPGDVSTTPEGFTIVSLIGEYEVDKWNGHCVAWAENITDDSEDLVLISLEEYNKLHLATRAGYETEATSMAATYKEGDLDGWEMPSESDAQYLMSNFGGENVDIVNSRIRSLGGTEITNTSTPRYLCDNAKKTYSFYSTGSRVTDGSATQTFSMRLIKRVHVTLQ